jgi:glycosyltransferase involved in cell wall biosynthesis
MYKEKNGYNLTPVGKFIPEEKYLAEAHIRKNVLFINPLLAKGALIVIQLAMALEKRRPDIVFEVVESRGNWDSLLKSFTKSIGKQRSSLSNITISKNTNNMKSIYGHTKLLLVPSLWFESAGRVIIEAQVNGIPSIGSSNGGIPEMIGDGGVVVNFPKELYKAPYNKILDKQSIEKITSVIERFYDDKSYYKKYQLQALNNYHNNHNIDKNTKILIDTIER